MIPCWHSLGIALFFFITCISGKEKYQLLKVRPETQRQLLYLQAIRANVSAETVSFWEKPYKVGDLYDVMVSGEAVVPFQRQLNARGLNFTTLSSDVAKSLEERQEKERILETWSRRFADGVSNADASFLKLHRYHSLQEMEQFMASLQRRYPKLARVHTLGITHDGYPLKALEVTGSVRNRAQKKWEMLIEGGMHAREWVAPHVALYIMAKLLSSYSHDRVMRKMVNNMRWMIIPTSNPDGYHHTWQARTVPRAAFWRKNRSPLTCHEHVPHRCCRGVDLNRNWDFEWGGTDTSEDPCSDVFPGTEPFSEPETRAIRDYVWPRRRRMRAFISLHSYSQILAYSSAAYRGYYPNDVKDLDRVGRAAKAALKAKYGTNYDVGSSADSLYPASGTALDWMKEKAKIKYSFLVELRPDKDYFNGLDAFFPDPATLLPTGRETWEAVKVIARAALSP